MPQHMVNNGGYFKSHYLRHEFLTRAVFTSFLCMSNLENVIAKINTWVGLYVPRYFVRNCIHSTNACQKYGMHCSDVKTTLFRTCGGHIVVNSINRPMGVDYSFCKPSV